MADVMLPPSLTARQLVKAYRFFRANPGTTWRFDVWTDQEARPASAFFEWFRARLTEKLYSMIPREANHLGRPCRKLTDKFDQEASFLHRQFTGNRVIIDWVPPIMGRQTREAFAHRLREGRS